MCVRERDECVYVSERERVCVCVCWRETGSIMCCLHQTMKNRVLLKFSQDFHQFFDHQDYDIIFQFSR